MHAVRPEPLIVGNGDGEPERMNASTASICSDNVGDSDGAQAGSMPVVPWANPMTGHPPTGASVRGVNTAADTTVGAPVSPDDDR